MNDSDIERIRAELVMSYPGCRVKVVNDGRELIAEISDGFAVAVIERSLPHFHVGTREVYRVLRGTVHMACGGLGKVLHEGETAVIEPGQIHFARAASEPVWIEVRTVPPWSREDHFIL